MCVCVCSKFYPSTVADLAYYKYATMRQFKNQKKHNSSSIFFFFKRVSSYGVRS